ncbi:putative flavin-binding monooxygenase [Acephala macrosclerotiorum]|nr:putative flavin-binding monooxygenase [Acephala macrosclerotiorum]
MKGLQDTLTKAIDESIFDVIIIGAGISGINTAYRIQSQLPSCKYAIFEARDSIGGTWDLFRYPGIRSDSDLFTFGFPWYPWVQSNPIAEASSILKYMKEAAQSVGIDKHIHFNYKVNSASWSSKENAWRLSVTSPCCEDDATPFSARFVIFCTGYYDYHEPLKADIPGIDDFQGAVIHPQFWPENYDYADKDVVVIGSGATAITLVPAMADKAKQVTMLQRSPSYIASISNTSWLSRILPRSLTRLNWIIHARLFYLFCRWWPKAARRHLLSGVDKELPATVPRDPHFEPRYKPWDQRLCMCPGGDFFKSLHTGRANVKTDTIKQVKSDHILLDSGDTLAADVIVTATGLKLHFGGHVAVEIDGTPYDFKKNFVWRGFMTQDLPNAAFCFGYTNAAWTLGANAAAISIVRIIQFMQKNGLVAMVPRLQENSGLRPRGLLDLNSTYVKSGGESLPKVGDRGPWTGRNHYLADLMFAKYGKLDECMQKIPGPNFRLTEEA